MSNAISGTQFIKLSHAQRQAIIRERNNRLRVELMQYAMRKSLR